MRLGADGLLSEDGLHRTAMSGGSEASLGAYDNIAAAGAVFSCGLIAFALSRFGTGVGLEAFYRRYGPSRDVVRRSGPERTPAREDSGHRLVSRISYA